MAASPVLVGILLLLLALNHLKRNPGTELATVLFALNSLVASPYPPVFF